MRLSKRDTSPQAGGKRTLEDEEAYISYMFDCSLKHQGKDWKIFGVSANMQHKNCLHKYVHPHKVGVVSAQCV
jgi:hypothetical protein